MRVRPALVLAGLLSAGVLLAGCSSSDAAEPIGSRSPAASSPTSSSPLPTQSRTPTTAPPTSASPSESFGLDVAVTVSDGKVTPATERYDVPLGSEVRLAITSDVADDIHVHGYDVEKSVDPGGTVVFEFTADIPGVVEVETHESGLLLFQLAVS